MGSVMLQSQVRRLRWVAVCLAVYLGGTAPAWGVGLLGSSANSGTNPNSLFAIDVNTGAATLIGPAGTTQGISALAVDPLSGTLYGIHGAATRGAILVRINPMTGAATAVGPLTGTDFDQAVSGSGSDALAFAAGGTLYAGGWNGGTNSNGQLLRVNPATGAVLASLPTTSGTHLAGLAFDHNGTLWASHGNNFNGELHTIDPATGAFLTTLPLSDAGAVVSDIAFASDGTLYAALSQTNQLATINPIDGTVTVIGSFGSNVSKMSGITFAGRSSPTAPTLSMGLLTVLALMLTTVAFYSLRRRAMASVV
jgi:streptogramin lyase